MSSKDTSKTINGARWFVA